MSTFIHPFTDFGFKKLFGEEASAPLLIDALNQILPGEHHIESLVFLPTEQLSRTAEERRAIFDLHCKGANGHSFIVEMQRAHMAYFKDRSVFYTTFPIARQAQKGEWDYKLEPVFCVAFLDFKLPREPGEEDYGCVTRACLRKENGRPFWDKLHFIQVELPRFDLKLEELVSREDKWFYFLKHLATMEDAPELFKNDPVFKQALSTANLAAMSPVENARHQDSLKQYWDWFAVLKTSRDEGLEEGLEKGEAIGLKKGLEMAQAENVRRLLSKNMSDEKIADLLGLELDEVTRLKPR